jgi:capsular polysaccharide biosynthesis protein
MDCRQMQVRSEERDRGSFGMTHEHWWIVFIVTAVATIAAGIVSFLLPSVYQATVSLIPPGDILQDEAQLAVRMGIGRNSAAGRSIAITSIADVYVGLLKSRVVADGVIEKCGLMDAYGPGESRDKVRLRLTRNAMVKLSGSGIITLTVEDRDPGRAASIANAYVEELDRQSKRLSVERAAGKRVFLENRLHEIDRLLSRIDSLPSREVRI